MQILKAFWCQMINGKQTLDESYTTKYQKHFAFSYGYKLLVLMISLVSLISHIKVKMQFTTLLIV